MGPHCKPTQFSHHTAIVLLALGLSAILSASSLAVDPATAINLYSHQVWQTADGLPHDSVTSIVQDGTGYLWLGTEEGLVRFDGARFTVFNRKNTPALKESYVRVLFPDPDGALWIGGRSYGLT